MKIKNYLRNFFGILFFGCFALMIGSNVTLAQTKLDQVPDLLPPVLSPSISHGLTEIYQAIGSSGLSTATNYAVEPYLTYAPSAPKGAKIGGGVFVAYNINHFLGAGLGFDYLGKFSLVSANVQLKAPIQFGKYIPANWTFLNWARDAVFCPFGIGGLGKGLGGDTSGAIAVTDLGAYLGIGHLGGGRFNLGYAYGRWDNAGIYSGPRQHIFGGWNIGF